MPNSPKENEQKMQRMLNAWQTLAPEKSFGGMTLAQFQAAVQPAQAAREQLADLEDQIKQALTDRDNADAAFQAKAQLVISGVLADPTEGSDSALYEAFGYTRKSERKTGLTRKRKPSPTQ
jgi:gas vesicle protein